MFQGHIYQSLINIIDDYSATRVLRERHTRFNHFFGNDFPYKQNEQQAVGGLVWLRGRHKTNNTPKGFICLEFSFWSGWSGSKVLFDIWML